MSFSNKVLAGMLLVCLGLGSVRAQENLTAYWQPSVALNYTVSETYSHNFSLQNRNYIFDDEEAQLSIRQLDLVHFSNLKLQDNQSIALGILYRFRETFDGGANELRLTQQYNTTSKPFVVRYGHRLRTEQRITSERVTHRFRYRFTIDFPLNGEKLDVGEPYLVSNLESLLSVAKEKQPQYDARFTLHLGWKLSERIKLQFGAEYRTEDFGQDLQHVLFFLSALNVSL
ncbi:MAG: DUF2490 domain-containing protein [Bacteroidota bacterium]